MVRRTTTTSGGGDGHTPDVMEAISVDAIETIGAARGKIIELLEMVDEHLSGTVKTAFKNRIVACRDAFDSLQDAIEALMELGEPVGEPTSAPFPEILEAVEAIEALGHEARLMVVDWTLYQGIYPFFGEVELPEDDD